jgi:hypothetical protein
MIYSSFSIDNLAHFLGKIKQIFKPDWDQTDEAATDYIKNKTHWHEVIETEPVYEDKITSTTSSSTTIAEGCGYSGTYYESAPEECPSLVEGHTYRIYLDNDIYDCVARAGEVYTALDVDTLTHVEYTSISLGNSYLENVSKENSGEPFFIDLRDKSLTIGFYTTLGDHNIKIVELQDIYHKLDSRYIDDDIARLDDIKFFTNEEAIKCLEAAGFVDLYTDKDNEIHVDDSNTIYIL